MKILYFAIIVLSISVHSVSWGMLTVSKIQPRVAKKYFTQEKIERDEQRASEESQKFLNSFGHYSFDDTGDHFFGLSKLGQKRTLRCLTDYQALFLRIAINKGIDVYILSELFNGNQKVAMMYCQKPIGEILEAYASAKEMKKWCPIFMKDGVMGILKEQHYMALKDSQRVLLYDVDQKATIHSADVPQFMRILNILKEIDLETIGIGDIKSITDSIKLYPSLSERAKIFYGVIPNDSFKFAFLLSLGTAGICGSLGGMLSAMILKGEKFSQIDWKFIGGVDMCLLPIIHTYYYLAFLGRGTYSHYQDHLKTNILPNQPTLTDYLKKTAL